MSQHTETHCCAHDHTCLKPRRNFPEKGNERVDLTLALLFECSNYTFSDKHFQRGHKPSQLFLDPLSTFPRLLNTDPEKKQSQISSY